MRLDLDIVTSLFLNTFLILSILGRCYQVAPSQHIALDYAYSAARMIPRLGLNLAHETIDHAYDAMVHTGSPSLVVGRPRRKR